MAEEEKGSGSPGEEPKKQPPRRRRRRPRRKPAIPKPAAVAQAAGQPKQAKQPPKKQAKKGAKKQAKRVAKKGRPAPRLPTQREVSAGGVVYRKTDDGVEVVLASRRTRRGDLAWGLAKGGIEEGESREEAAVREVREETGLLGEIEADLGDTKYIYVWEDVRIRKTVHFYLMRLVGGDIDDRDDEMEEIRWFPLDRAIKRAAYRGERDILAKASGMLG